ncbi:hypothetical protein TRFO_34440 [Tritrichomonas foetus]|uniref:Uncharacterized protein n=1 Tax=Tritrichomonas foetus TaxID=1144522 RepID=A0A1J4JPG6_9EUKA|nr:hypothetical protein TRFO_34440 [Tritrichomonas foetus]|eukprot:OHS99164.1 hypothetical protein TRFO_34440 [Tritrichomonas foetus]
MEDLLPFDLSASSCFTEGEDVEESEKDLMMSQFEKNQRDKFGKMDVMDVQTVLLENERLQELNTQLQKALDSTKIQLKQAIEASASVTAMSDQIQGLKFQLSQMSQEKDRISNELSNYKNSFNNFDQSSNENDTTFNGNNVDFLNSSNSMEKNEYIRKLKKYKEEIKILIKENEAQKKTIESLTISHNKLQKRKSKISENLKSAVSQLKDSEDRVDELESEKQKFETSVKAMLQENENLKDQINAYQTIGNETKISYDNLNEEIVKQRKEFSLLQKQFENQSIEITKLNNERQELYNLTNNLLVSCVKYETLTNELINDKEILERKIKANKFNGDEERINLTESDIPFEGDLRMKCLKILMIEQYTPSHKIQMIFNEINQYTKQLFDQMAEATSENEELKAQFNIERNGAEKYREMMRSLLKELKNVTFYSEKINNTAFCENDRQFMDLMIRSINSIDPLVSDSENSYPSSPPHRYIPLNFFSNDDQNQNQQVIMKEIQPSDEAFSLFTAQFLLNTILKQKLQKLIDASVKKDELESIIRSLNGNGLIDLPKLLEALKEQMKKMKLSRKREHEAFKKIQQELLEKNKSENDLKITIEQLKVQNDVLQNECNLLKVKADVSSNELLLRSISNENPLSNNIIVSPDSSLLKNELNKKKEEIQKLRQTLSNIQFEMSQIQKHKDRSSKRIESDLTQQIIDLQNSLQEMTEANAILKKKLKKVKKIYIKKVEESAIEYQKKYDESKQSFDDCALSMKEKQKQSHDLTQKLLKSLSESEGFNQKCQSENADLHLENKQLQLKLSTLQEEISRERQVLKGQMSALQLACDSKIHEVLRETKSAVQNEKDRLFNVMVMGLSSVYKIDCTQFDEDSYVKLVEQLKRDIEKLRFFQNNVQFS